MSQSAGIFFHCYSTDRFLYLLRTADKNWGIPGGKIKKDETIIEGLERECIEELGVWPENVKLIPIQKFVNNSFIYHTFFCQSNNEFTPLLNNEHCGYAWVGDNQYPKPLHPGLFNTVNFDLVQNKLKALTRKGT